MIVYISGPYTLGDTVENVRKACEAGDKLLEKGHIPFIPHLSMLWHFHSHKTYEEWLRIDKAMIPMCDAVLRLPGESKGADAEVELAHQLKLPVYFSIDNIGGD